MRRRPLGSGPQCVPTMPRSHAQFGPWDACNSGLYVQPLDKSDRHLAGEIRSIDWKCKNTCNAPLAFPNLCYTCLVAGVYPRSHGVPGYGRDWLFNNPELNALAFEGLARESTPCLLLGIKTVNFTLPFLIQTSLK